MDIKEVESRISDLLFEETNERVEVNIFKQDKGVFNVVDIQKAMDALSYLEYRKNEKERESKKNAE